MNWEDVFLGLKALYYLVHLTVTIALALLVYVLLQRKKWMGLHVMMFHATVAAIGFSLGLFFAAIFTSSIISWQAAIFFGMYFFIMAAIMCSVHV